MLINYTFFAKIKIRYSPKTFDLQNRAWETSHEKSILKSSKNENKQQKKLRSFIQVSAEWWWMMEPAQSKTLHCSENLQLCCDVVL